MPYLPDLPVSARSARCGRAIGRNAVSDGPLFDLRWLGSKIGRSLGYLLAHHDDVVPNTVACIFAARAWLGEIDRAAEDGGAYLRGSIASFTGMHSPGAWKPMISQLRSANIPRVTVFQVTAIARAIPNCRFGGVFAGHGGSGYLASIEMYARLKALLERMTRPERAARSLVCYPLGVSLRSPQRGG
jgi:hypothetical protein